MKLKYVQFGIILLLFNSCIVLSIHPFYTIESIDFEKKLLGNWEDGQNNNWEIIAFKEYYLGKNQKEKLSADSLNFLKKYSSAYLIKLDNKDYNEIKFVGMPFKIDNQLFIDFYLFEYDYALNELALLHLVGLHSLAKVEILANNTVNLVWLGDEKLKYIIDQNKIKIKYEKIGLNKDKYILSANSESLEKFIQKFMISQIPNKWDSGEEQLEFQLKKKNG